MNESMHHEPPQAPRRVKIAAGAYMTADKAGNYYTIQQHPIRKDWDARDDQGVLCAREESLSDCLDEVASWHRFGRYA